MLWFFIPCRDKDVLVHSAATKSAPASPSWSDLEKVESGLVGEKHTEVMWSKSAVQTYSHPTENHPVASKINQEALCVYFVNCKQIGLAKELDQVRYTVWQFR